MSAAEKKVKRTRATEKLCNQVKVLKRTALKKELETIAQIETLAKQLTGATL